MPICPLSSYPLTRRLAPLFSILTPLLASCRVSYLSLSLRLCSTTESGLANFLAYLAPLFVYSFSPFSSYAPLSRSLLLDTLCRPFLPSPPSQRSRPLPVLLYHLSRAPPR